MVVLDELKSTKSVKLFIVSNALYYENIQIFPLLYCTLYRQNTHSITILSCVVEFLQKYDIKKIPCKVRKGIWKIIYSTERYTEKNIQTNNKHF